MKTITLQDGVGYEFTHDVSAVYLKKTVASPTSVTLTGDGGSPEIAPAALQDFPTVANETISFEYAGVTYMKDVPLELVFAHSNEDQDVGTVTVSHLVFKLDLGDGILNASQNGSLTAITIETFEAGHQYTLEMVEAPSGGTFEPLNWAKKVARDGEETSILVPSGQTYVVKAANFTEITFSGGGLVRDYNLTTEIMLLQNLRQTTGQRAIYIDPDGVSAPYYDNVIVSPYVGPAPLVLELNNSGNDVEIYLVSMGGDQ